MTTTPTKHAQHSTSARWVLWAIVALCAVLAGYAFVRGRESNWTLGSLYVGLFATSVVVNLMCVLLFNPIVIMRRMVFHRGTKTWDIGWVLAFLAILVAIYFVARHDLTTRSATIGPPGITWLIGAFTFIFGWAIVTWAMIANPFFEKTVRIQTDHGHRVIDNGPYAIVRHPGYVGFSSLILATPLLLASAWTFLPTAFATVWLVIRTILEDRTLQAELPGYTEYSTRVRYRLIPKVW